MSSSRLLTEQESNLLSDGLTALRHQTAREATTMLRRGNDRAVRHLLGRVTAIDNLTAIVARDDIATVLYIAGTDTDSARMTQELSGHRFVEPIVVEVARTDCERPWPTAEPMPGEPIVAGARRPVYVEVSHAR